MSEPSLAVVLLNYRTPELVIDCLRSLVEQLDPRDRVVVVDNASGDGSPESIERELKRAGWTDRVLLVRSERNGGFAAGNNLGIAALERDAYLLLNSDTWLRPGALAELRRAAASHPRAGLVGPRLEWPDGRPQVSAFRYRTPLGELVEAADTGPLARLFWQREVPLPPADAPHEAQWLSFACVLVRREVLLEIGPLDEGYFMYFEDLDYCRRACDAGWRALHWPAAHVVHLQGGSSETHGARARRARPPLYYYASRARYFRKFYGPWGLWRANLLWTAGRALAWLRERLGKPRQACEREWRDIWCDSLRPTGAERGQPEGRP